MKSLREFKREREKREEKRDPAISFVTASKTEGRERERVNTHTHTEQK